MIRANFGAIFIQIRIALFHFKRSRAHFALIHHDKATNLNFHEKSNKVVGTTANRPSNDVRRLVVMSHDINSKLF